MPGPQKLGFFICGAFMKEIIVRLARKPVAWVALTMLLSSAGIAISPLQSEAIKLLGPAAAESIEIKADQ